MHFYLPVFHVLSAADRQTELHFCPRWQGARLPILKSVTVNTEIHQSHENVSKIEDGKGSGRCVKAEERKMEYEEVKITRRFIKHRSIRKVRKRNRSLACHVPVKRPSLLCSVLPCRIIIIKGRCNTSSLSNLFLKEIGSEK